MGKNKVPQRFGTISEFIQFFNNNKLTIKNEVEDMVNDGFETKITFTDESYAVISYRAGFMSDSGTWWVATFDILYLSNRG